MKKIAYLILAALLAVSVTACKKQDENLPVKESSIQSSQIEEISEIDSNEPMPDTSEYSEDESDESSEPFIEPVQTTVSDYQSVVVGNKCRLLLYTGTEQRIIVPDKVNVDGKEYETEIGPGCFRDKEITSLTLPDNITVIPESMCEKCKMLEVVTFGNVQTIEKNAFWECEKLRFRFDELNFGDQTKIKRIGERAFGFTGLYGKVIIRPDMELEDGAFQICKQLDEVEIQSGITEIPDRAFAENKGLKKITLPNTLKKIGNAAFTYIVADTVTIPKSVTEMGLEAFSSSNGMGGKYTGIMLGYKGSAAEEYAEKNGIVFSPLD